MVRNKNLESKIEPIEKRNILKLFNKPKKEVDWADKGFLSSVQELEEAIVQVAVLLKDLL